MLAALFIISICRGPALCEAAIDKSPATQVQCIHVASDATHKRICVKL